MNGHTETLKVLAEASDWDLISRRDEEGCTVLHWAARAGKDETVKYLLSLRDELLLYILDKKDRTALHMAAQWGKPSTMQVLSEAADVDLIYATDSKGMTCLDLALRGAFGESCPMVSQVIWGMRQCGRNGRHFLALGLG
mmetsp:Transcript_3683/g.5828  ORF Transcript_3683/g.5828 Transcript_3683/m.5828 type:complete len:140 (-) Transcript_3683:177-596(-)